MGSISMTRSRREVKASSEDFWFLLLCRCRPAKEAATQLRIEPLLAAKDPSCSPGRSNSDSARRSDSIDHSVCGCNWRFVLPNLDRCPVKLHQSPRGVGIPGDVACDFGCPPFGVPLRLGEMLGTTVPPAAEHAHSHARGGKDDVDLARRPGKDAAVKPEAQSATMEFRPKCHFDAGALRRLEAHPPANRLTRWRDHLRGWARACVRPCIASSSLTVCLHAVRGASCRL